MLATWLNYQPDVPALGGDGEQRHFEGGDGGRRCRVDGLAEMERQARNSDDKGLTSFGITFTGPLAGTPSYTPA